MSNPYGRDRVYMKITDALREELIRQVILYKVPVYVACVPLKIKYITANNIIKLYQKAMANGIKTLPRPKELDIRGGNIALKNELPSFDSIASEIEELTRRG